MDHYLQFENITKTFPGVKALDKVSFGLDIGSIHGLVGENGAGKSTLLNILSGVFQPNDGYISIDGKKVNFNNTKDALDAGIAIIYQELNLVPEMTIGENLMLGKFPQKNGFVNRGQLRKKAEKQIKELMDGVDPDTKVKNLSMGQKQMVEIGKALMQEAKVIAFDEPTSSLSEREIQHLYKIINSLKKQGCVIIYVSHRMEEIFDLCDACTVFRDGKHIETFRDMDKVSSDLLVSKMVGREISDVYGYEPREKGEVLFQAKDIFGPGVNKKISFQVASGEIVGFFGLVGAGRTESFKLIYGDTPRETGIITVKGKKVEINNPMDAIKNNICLLPEDRKDEGIIGIRSASENINVSSRRHTLKGDFFVNKDKEDETANKFVDALDIKTPSINQLAGNLSGGNQQKVILSRWLSEDIDIFLMDEPTRGIDVGAKYEIYKIIYQLASEGKAVAFISSDLPEVMGVADRIIVMRDGEIIGSVDRGEATEEKILSMALPTSRK